MGLIVAEVPLAHGKVKMTFKMDRNWEHGLVSIFIEYFAFLISNIYIFICFIVTLFPTILSTCDIHVHTDATNA